MELVSPRARNSPSIWLSVLLVDDSSNQRHSNSRSVRPWDYVMIMSKSGKQPQPTVHRLAKGTQDGIWCLSCGIRYLYAAGFYHRTEVRASFVVAGIHSTGQFVADVRHGRRGDMVPPTGDAALC